MDKISPKSIIFIKFFGLGSMILTLPAVKHSRELYPSADLYFLTFSGNYAIKQIVSELNDTTFITVDPSSPFSFIHSYMKAIWFCNRKEFDISIDFEFFSRFSALSSFLINAHCRTGFFNHHMEGLYRGDIFTHKIFYNHYQHTADAFIDLVEAVDSPYDYPLNKAFTKRPLPVLNGGAVTLSMSGADIDEILSISGLSGKPFIVLNPNCSFGFIDQRMYPEANFARIAKRLLSLKNDLFIVVVGAKSDQRRADSLTNLISDNRVLNLAGMTSLKELVVILDHSLCLITNDSGISHVGSLTKTHVITLFGPDTPILFSPLSNNKTDVFLDFACSPCGNVYNGKRTVCSDNLCMQKIDPDTIADIVISRVLNQENKHHN
jgi:ADP-heptose:LPS heptosyltransferase